MTEVVQGSRWRHIGTDREVKVVAVLKVYAGVAGIRCVELRPVSIIDGCAHAWSSVRLDHDWAIGQGTLRTGEPAVLYEHAGLRWVRDAAEFVARFEEL